MKILVITDLYPVSETEEKTPRTIYDFVKEWKALGHEVRVIKPNFIFNSFLRSKPFYKNGKYGDVENINYWLPFLGNVKNKIKTDLNVDLVIAHMPSGLIFADKLDLPLVAGVHVSDIEVLTNPLYSIYFKNKLKKVYKKAKKIACRSEVLRQKFLKRFPEYESKTFVAYSGISPEIIIKKEWKPEKTVKIITCANLIKRKNVDKLILACEGINNIDLTVVGSGKELGNLKKLSSKVKFLGQLSHDRVLEEMRKSDIFVLPSKNETFGMVYLEAMASGCITVGLKGDGIDGIIKDSENGYLCDLDNITGVIEKIINSDDQNMILENSFNTILNYTKEKACLNYLNNI